MEKKTKGEDGVYWSSSLERPISRNKRTPPEINTNRRPSQPTRPGTPFSTTYLPSLDNGAISAEENIRLESKAMKFSPPGEPSMISQEEINYISDTPILKKEYLKHKAKPQRVRTPT